MNYTDKDIEAAEKFASERYDAQGHIESAMPWSDCKDAVLFGIDFGRSNPIQVEAKSDEEIADEECFEYHGCFTGDCPHESARDCGLHFFKTGQLAERSKPKEPSKEVLEFHKTIKANLRQWSEGARADYVYDGMEQALKAFEASLSGER